jgi:hypothetical protein
MNRGDQEGGTKPGDTRWAGEWGTTGSTVPSRPERISRAMTYRGKKAIAATRVTRESMPRFRSSRRPIHIPTSERTAPAIQQAVTAMSASGPHGGIERLGPKFERDTAAPTTQASTATPDSTSDAPLIDMGRVRPLTSSISLVNARRPRGIPHSRQWSNPGLGQPSGTSAPHLGQTEGAVRLEVWVEATALLAKALGFGRPAAAPHEGQ